MSKYDNYGSFMLAVLDEADKKCNNTIYGSLVRLLGSKGVDENIMRIVVKILEIGWPAFVSVCVLLLLGPIAFVAALATFIVGGIGAVIVAALAIYGGVKAIKLLYVNKTTPLRIYEVGKEYKPRFDSHKGEYSYIDMLIDEASDDIIK